ncbi:hypothetical protein [Haloarchaeobius sp. TZWWS8]|uniref:hypothetical protein n=1 Tax=Haloarchaeobius sp. TZWWS8 TaxID=3446121 RepID=UPI003EBCA970
MEREDSFDDPIASAVVAGTAYERLRVRRFSLFSQSIPRKLAWQGIILLGLALVLPLAMTLPESTRTFFPGGDPVWSAPKILLLGAYAGTIELVGGAGLVYVASRRLQSDDDLSEHEARRLLNVEDVASMISLVTGAVAVFAVDGFLLLGHGGEPAVRSFLAAGGRNPFAGTPVPVSAVVVAVPAVLLAAFLFAWSWHLNRRLPETA